MALSNLSRVAVFGIQLNVARPWVLSWVFLLATSNCQTPTRLLISKSGPRAANTPEPVTAVHEITRALWPGYLGYHKSRWVVQPEHHASLARNYPHHNSHLIQLQKKPLRDRYVCTSTVGLWCMYILSCIDSKCREGVETLSVRMQHSCLCFLGENLTQRSVHIADESTFIFSWCIGCGGDVHVPRSVYRLADARLANVCIYI